MPGVPPSGAPLLLDVKGCGVPAGHRAVPGGAHGLLPLTDAVGEVAMSRLVRAALEHAGHSTAVVAHYAIIDLGIDVLDARGTPTEPAVLLVRRARPRPLFQWGTAHPGAGAAAALLDIELVLRRYGITASSSGAIRFRVRAVGGAGVEIARDGRRLPIPAARAARIARRIGFCGRPLHLDGVNVQVTTGGGAARELIDFGCYRLRADFAEPLYAAQVRDCEELRGLFLPPAHPRYTLPDPRVDLAGAFDLPEWHRVRRLVATYRRTENAGLQDAVRSFDGAVAELLDGPRSTSNDPDGVQLHGFAV